MMLTVDEEISSVNQLCWEYITYNISNEELNQSQSLFAEPLSYRASHHAEDLP